MPKETKSAPATQTAYCVKCRAKREMKNPVAVTMKNGKPAIKGSCPVCGTGMFRIGELRYLCWRQVR